MDMLLFEYTTCPRADSWKSAISSLSCGVLLCRRTGHTRWNPKLLLNSCRLWSSYPGSAAIKCAFLVVSTGRLDANVPYAWLSLILAVVTSVYRGKAMGPVLHTMCNLYPNTQPLVWLKPHRASVSIPEHGTIPCSIEDLCQTRPLLALTGVLSIAMTCGLTMPSETNRHPIALPFPWCR